MIEAATTEPPATAEAMLEAVRVMILNRIDELTAEMEKKQATPEQVWGNLLLRKMEAEYIIATCTDPKWFAPRKQPQ